VVEDFQSREQLGVVLGLTAAGYYPDRHVVPKVRFVSGQNRPMLWSVEIELKNDSMGFLG
jgi:hypothetical protein